MIMTFRVVYNELCSHLRFDKLSDRRVKDNGSYGKPLGETCCKPYADVLLRGKRGHGFASDTDYVRIVSQ